MLIRNSDTLKQHLAMASQFDFNLIKPYILQAELNYIIPHLGQEIVDELEVYADSVDSGGPANADKDKLLAKVIPALAPLAFSLFVPIGSVHISSAGFSNIENQHNKAIYKYQKDDLISNFRLQGYTALEHCLSFLQSKTGTYTTWASSSTATAYKSHLVKTTSAFNSYAFINNSSLVFIALKPAMEFILQSRIYPAICQNYYGELVTKTAEDDLGAADKAILPWILRAICNYTLAGGLRTQAVDNHPDRGMSVYGFLPAAEMRRENSTIDPESRLSTMLAALKAQGDFALDKIIKILQEAPDDYPTAKACGVIAEEGDQTITDIINDKDKGFYAVY